AHLGVGADCGCGNGAHALSSFHDQAVARGDLPGAGRRRHHPARTMFPQPPAETLSAVAATRPDKARISRAATHLVVGIDEGIAGTVFGTMTTMATITAYGRAFPDSPWKLEELVVSTAIVLWIAHIYAHGLSESISERRPLRPDAFWTIARRERGILL